MSIITITTPDGQKAIRPPGNGWVGLSRRVLPRTGPNVGRRRTMRLQLWGIYSQSYRTPHRRAAVVSHCCHYWSPRRYGSEAGSGVGNSGIEVGIYTAALFPIRHRWTTLPERRHAAPPRAVSLSGWPSDPTLEAIQALCPACRRRAAFQIVHMRSRRLKLSPASPTCGWFRYWGSFLSAYS